MKGISDNKVIGDDLYSYIKKVSYLKLGLLMMHVDYKA